MEKGNSSNSNNTNKINPSEIVKEFWGSFFHSTLNDQQKQRGEWTAMCRQCSQTCQYNVHEPYYDLPLRWHYLEHVKEQKESERPKRYDWSEYLPPKPIPQKQQTCQPSPLSPFSMVESIFNFRGDHTVICTKCGQIFNYQETILREHYSDHNRREAEETEARYREAERKKREESDKLRSEYWSRRIEESRKKKLKEEKEKEKWRKEIQDMQMRDRLEKAKREEERRNAARCMAEIEKQEADAAFWNEAAHMADNAGASNQHDNENEEDEPWWDEILQYVKSQDL